MTQVYQTIKAKRLQLNISQKEMSERLKMQQAGYSQLEKGKTQVTVERLQKIADIFGVPITYFFNKNVQELVDALIERVEDLNALHAQNSFVPDLPDRNQETIEFHQKRDRTNEKLISSLEHQIETLRELTGYQQREINAAKELCKLIEQNLKFKKAIKPDLIERIHHYLNR